LKSFENIEYTKSVEEIDMQLSTIAPQEHDLETVVDTFTEALQSTGRKTFKTIRAENKTKRKKSVRWWTNSLTITRRRVNALRRLYQRTRNNEDVYALGQNLIFVCLLS
jgi:paraquat-inducible protein B